MIWTSNNRVIAAQDNYCCLLPQCVKLFAHLPPRLSDCNNTNWMEQQKNVPQTHLEKSLQQMHINYLTLVATYKSECKPALEIT